MGPGSPDTEQGEHSSAVLVQCAGSLKLHAGQGQAISSSWLVFLTTFLPQARAGSHCCCCRLLVEPEAHMQPQAGTLMRRLVAP